jgi:hypothetical protein
VAHRFTRLVVTAALALSPALPAAQRPSPGGLKIVVIAGEDAVNVIQQKTAASPVVEVRDRNDLPVGGATVVFSITGGRAVFAGGASQVTVTTNAAGRAAAAALSPTESGLIRIEIQTSFQGQTASATITQTNVATAADAAAQSASKPASSGGSGTAAGASGAAGAAAGGGLSGAAIAGIVGGAAAGVGVGLKAASGGGGNGDGGGGGGDGGGGGGTAGTTCRFTLSQSSVSTSSAAATVNITVTVEPAGCSNPSWTATATSASNFFLLGNNSPTTSATGSSPFSVNVPANTTGAQRSGSVTISPAGLTVPVTQAANCLFSVAPAAFGTVSGAGGTAVVSVGISNSPCDPPAWTAFSNTPASATVSPASGTGAGSVTVTFLPNSPLATGPRPVSVTVAGQVIQGSQNAGSATLSCSAQAMRGGDAGDTRTFDLGRSSGSFVLTYDTGDRSDDRVVVFYEGRPLFDSGCVSTAGPQSRALSFSGASSLVTVQVMPNCGGGWGSAWAVTLACGR